ncbi:MAG: hypothetical protein E7594_02865 [Ruminococcaceae bacterium]|nr:hypothetical protein [Oscillospiraceae bacterium]
MDTTNTPTPSVQRKPLSVKVLAFCTIVFLACQIALPVLLHYINLIDPTSGAGLNIPSAISFGVLAICATFALTLCRRPLFLTCSVIGLVASFLLSPWFCALFAALLCAIVSGAALLADAKGAAFLPFSIAAPAAFGLSLLLTQNLMLSLLSLLPALGALALAVSFRNKLSLIVSIGTVTGTLVGAFVLLILGNLMLAGMPLSAEGITNAVGSFHASVSQIFAEALQMMADTPELAAQVEQMLGGQLDTKIITEFSESISYAVLGLLPGCVIMLTWLISFTANRGFTAVLLHGQPKEACPEHLSQYAPSVPTAVLMILCYAVLLICSMIPAAEVVVFIALNLLCVLMPILAVMGISITITNVKRAPVKWPLILTYVIAFLFLGIAIIPMLAFFGAFGVIMQALAKVFEKKMKDSQGDN